jgi:hypothetical protein
MRLTLVVVFCLLNAACAVVRHDKDEPVDEGPKKVTAEPVLKPSEVLKPKVGDFASPITDHFYMRLTYFSAPVTTTFQLDRDATTPGTTLSAEDDLGLDDKVDQARLEFDIRMRERGHMRVDFFKLDRFHEQPLPRDIVFGDFDFAAGTVFRSKLDWRELTFTYTYSFIKSERFEAGLGLGLALIQADAEGGQPGTLNREKTTEAGIFPTIAGTAAFRISKRWAVTVRGQQFSASPNDFDGTMAEYHGDIQYRMRKNLALGLGYTEKKTDLKVFDPNQPVLFILKVNGPELFLRASF